MGLQRPKPFLSLGGAPMVAHALAALEAAPSVDGVVLVVPPDDPGPSRALAASFPKVRRVVPGGETRRASVAAGLDEVGDAGFVLVHDAARPLATAALVEEVLAEARRSGAAVPGVPVADTLKEVEGETVSRTVDRERMVAIQTPQAFRTDWLRRAHAEVPADAPATDDAALLEALGIEVRVVPGEPDNLKVTREADLGLAEALLARRGRAR
jgi:2-C-methyl-D-erythritol 4-phosphate cytidylyltransferase